MKRLSWRRAVSRLAPLLIGLALGLAMAELAVRFVRPQAVHVWRPGPFTEDGPGRFRLRPGHQGTFTNRVEFDTRVAVNSFGLRGPEPQAASDDVARILVIGDSFTFGVGVEQAESYPVRTAELLSQAGVAAQGLTGGMPAVGVPQEVRWLERHGLALDPDLVVVGIFVGNDLRDATSGYSDWQVVDGQLFPAGTGSGLKEWLYYHSHLYVLAKQAVPSGLQRRVRDLLGLGDPWSLRSAREGFAIYAKAGSELSSEAARSTGAALDRLAELSRETEAGVAAVIIPDLVQLEDERWTAAIEQLGLDPEGYDSEVPNQLLANLLAVRGIPVLDLTPPLRVALAGGADLYFPIDGHWTPAGHELAAEHLVEFVTRQGLLSRPRPEAGSDEVAEPVPDGTE